MLFRSHTVKEFDPVSGAFVPKRTYRNRFLFDPTSRREPTIRQNPYGFEAGAPYVVVLPAADTGTPKTLRTPRGSPLQATFRTTFRTAGGASPAPTESRCGVP